jgi:ParB/RepB/Spo0J family partition protein
MTDTATRPPATLLDEQLPDELHPAPPAAPAVEQTYELLPVSLIRPGPHNPRRDLGDIEGLADSIRSVGILEPLVVEEYSGPLAQEPYTLLAGHRRHAAAQLAGLTEVPCLIRQTQASPALRLEMALVENLQREGLAPLDEADGYRELVKLGLSQRAIAERIGCSQSHVSKRLALLDLPDKVQAQVGKGSLTLEAAAALARLKDHPEKLASAAAERPDRIVWAVGEAESRIAWEAKVAELRTIAEGRGWPVVDEPVDLWAKRPFKLLARWSHLGAELELDTAKHEAEPCHAVMVPTRRTYFSEKPSATSVCTDPDRHGPDGASKLRVKVEPKPKLTAEDREQAKLREQRRADEEARKVATKTRRAFIAQALADLPASRQSKLTPALRATLNSLLLMEYDEGDVFVLLGLPHSDDVDPLDAVVAYAKTGDAELQRCALAIALADAEARMRYVAALSPEAVEHFAYLASLGYQLSPYEQGRLDEAEAEAKKAAGDA